MAIVKCSLILNIFHPLELCPKLDTQKTLSYAALTFNIDTYEDQIVSNLLIPDDHIK